MVEHRAQGGFGREDRSGMCRKRRNCSTAFSKLRSYKLGFKSVGCSGELVASSLFIGVN